jgi:hypothetical protein
MRASGFQEKRDAGKSGGDDVDELRGKCGVHCSLHHGRLAKFNGRLIRLLCFGSISPISVLVSSLFPFLRRLHGSRRLPQPPCNKAAAARHHPETSRR